MHLRYTRAPGRRSASRLRGPGRRANSSSSVASGARRQADVDGRRLQHVRTRRGQPVEALRGRQQCHRPGLRRRRCRSARSSAGSAQQLEVDAGSEAPQRRLVGDHAHAEELRGARVERDADVGEGARVRVWHDAQVGEVVGHQRRGRAAAGAAVRCAVRPRLTSGRTGAPRVRRGARPGPRPPRRRTGAAARGE